MNMALNMALAGTGFAPFDLPPPSLGIGKLLALGNENCYR